MDTFLINAAAVLVFVLGCAFAAVVASMPNPRRGDWSSATYGEDVSALDAADFAHRPWGPAPEKYQQPRKP